MVSAMRAAAPAVDEADRRQGSKPLRAVPQGWVQCSPETPWGVHGRILGKCTRCGWTP